MAVYRMSSSVWKELDPSWLLLPLALIVMVVVGPIWAKIAGAIPLIYFSLFYFASKGFVEVRGEKIKLRSGRRATVKLSDIVNLQENSPTTVTGPIRLFYLLAPATLAAIEDMAPPELALELASPKWRFNLFLVPFFWRSRELRLYFPDDEEERRFLLDLKSRVPGLMDGHDGWTS